jgi:hypothetical protein
MVGVDVGGDGARAPIAHPPRQGPRRLRGETPTLSAHADDPRDRGRPPLAVAGQGPDPEASTTHGLAADPHT